MIPEEDAQQVEAEIRALIEGTAAGFTEISIDVRRLLLARPLLTPHAGSAGPRAVLGRVPAVSYGLY